MNTFNPKQAAYKLKALSFVASRDGKALPKPVSDELPRCFWHVKSTGDYQLDTQLGTQIALEYLAYEDADKGGAGILNLIISDMPRPLGDVEDAFLQLVGLVAKNGYQRAQQIVAHWNAAEKSIAA